MSNRKRPFAISRALGKVIVTVHGDVDARHLRQTLVDLVDGQGNLDLVIDLRDADSLDPDGVAALARAATRVQQHGGVLVVSDPHPDVAQLLESSGLTATRS
jgi:anti-anti-sigma factor